MYTAAAPIARRIGPTVARLRGSRRAPFALLAVISVVSFAVRIAFVEDPCKSPCTAATDHTLVFDEVYYVNAARVIAGLAPPGSAPYAGSPEGVDPNSEHPQLAKLVIAGSIELFGDGPLAWRLGSIVLGSIALLGMFALARAAGGGPWLAVGATALMAMDNLMLVHGRIGTLDVYVLAAMVWGVALYLRGRPLLAGVVLGVGATAKLAAPYALLVLALLEATRLALGRVHGGPFSVAGAARRLAGCCAAATGVFFALLAIFDRIAPPYDPSRRHVVGGVIGHLAHMLSFQAAQTSPSGPRGIASYPWEWLGDYKPIVYLNIDPAHPAPGLYRIHPAVHFLGFISPPIMVAAIPGLVVAAWALRRARTEVPLVALAWFAGTWVPFELLSLIDSRTSYLYYMVVVMPGLYIAAVHLFGRWRPRGWVHIGWWVLVVLAAIALYPLTPIP